MTFITSLFGAQRAVLSPRRTDLRRVHGASNAAASQCRGALDAAHATATLERIQSSAAISGLGPTELLGNIGIALLGIAVIKTGAPRWAAAAISIGALGEGAGFGTHSKALVVIAFAVMFSGFVEAVRTLSAATRDRLAVAAAAAP